MKLLERAHRSGYVETVLAGKNGPHTSLFMSWVAMTTGTVYEIHKGLHGKKILEVLVEPLDRSAWTKTLEGESDIERDRR